MGTSIRKNKKQQTPEKQKQKKRKKGKTKNKGKQRKKTIKEKIYKNEEKNSASSPSRTSSSEGKRR